MEFSIFIILLFWKKYVGCWMVTHFGDQYSIVPVEGKAAKIE